MRARGYQETELTIDSRRVGEPVAVGLVPLAAFAEVVQVRGTLPEAEEPSAYEMAPREVLQAAGSVDNVFRTLGTLPGVSAVADFGSRLSVRGGLPDQNLTILDGVEIDNPFRLSRPHERIQS